MGASTIELSVVVPVYNAESTIAELVARSKSVLESLALDFELILVNDGSRDRSWAVIKEQGTQFPWVTGINLMRNYGQHNALLCGIRAARYGIVITMDDDLQHFPEDIPLLLSKLEEGFDVVYGVPKTREHNMWRNVASAMMRVALKIAVGGNVPYKASAFRAFRTELREAFGSYSGSHVAIDVLLTWGSTRFTEIYVGHGPRVAGESNYTFRRLVRLALNLVTGFSVAPLRFASIMGFSFTIFGIAVLAYVVGRYLILGYSVQGFPFLASIIALFAGVQLCCLGILGEYLATMHFRLMERPAYTVREVLSSESREPHRIGCLDRHADAPTMTKPNS
jgi:glycosyltransferase involved in cell wall biosynthesis